MHLSANTVDFMRRLFFALLSCIVLIACDDDKQVVDYSYPEGGETPSVPEVPTVPEGPSELYGTLPILHTEGRWLCDESGNHVNIHGFWQTYTPWFNGGAWGENNWGGRDYEGCVAYNKGIIDKIVASGIKVDFMRLHMDSYWFVDPNRPSKSRISEYFKEELMREYFDKVYLPVIKHCISKGIRVIIRPYPCGEEADQPLKYGDGFFTILEKMWAYFSAHKDIRNNADVMFELMNEPVNIDADAHGGNRDKAVSEYMQHFIDLIRKNCKNIIWVPGLTWQQYYQCFVSYPLKGDNLGFAVHCYPGWYGSDAESSTGENGGNMGAGSGGYEPFYAGWNNAIAAAAELHPILITEMDWAAEKYNKTWGKSATGLAGGSGFGANFKYIMDKMGNVSYMTFTAPNDLALFPTESKKATTNYWNDPECCPWQIYYWYEEYAKGNIQPESADKIVIGSRTGSVTLTKSGSKELIVNAIRNNVVFPLQTGVELASSDPSIVTVDGTTITGVISGTVTITAKALGLEASITVDVLAPASASELFPVKVGKFDVNIWEKGTLDEETKTFTTGQYGFAGWKFDNLDISMHKYLVVKLGDKTDFSCQPSFRLFDSNNYWGKPAMYDFKNEKEVRVEIANMKNEEGGKLNAKTICIIGFWTLGGREVQIDDIYFED